jgi:two-component system C4-dicarboxylate transport sensor histidine kinase DctB
MRARHADVGPVLDDLPALFRETYEGLTRTEGVVKQMKALMRLSSAGAREEAVDVHALVEAALRLMRSRLHDCVETQIEPGLVVRGRHVELCQALVNLLANAADSCEQRARLEPTHTPVIRVIARADGRGGCALHVEDNGVGIAAADLPRVFMPLFTTKPERGAGLGLSIVRRVVDDHHGKVRARSTPGGGAAFTMTLPLASAAGVLQPPLTPSVVAA